MDRLLKTTFRRNVDRMPVFVKKLLTKKKVERILSQLMSEADLQQCLVDPTAKDQIIQKCMQKNHAVANKIVQNIEATLSNNAHFKDLDDNRKKQIREDMLFCWYGYGFKIDEYIMYHFWDINIDHESRYSFLSDKELYAFRFCANDFTKTVYADKASAYHFLKKYYKRDMIVVTGEKDREAFIEFACAKQALVKKPLDLAHGDGVSLVQISEPSPENYVKYFESIKDEGEILFEEVIEQHAAMKVFNADSLNTIRVYTLNTKNGIVIPTSIIRTGRLGSFVDNVSSGGVSARIDVDTGTIITDAIDKFGNRYVKHPDTQLQFKGFAIPQWDDLIGACKEAATLTPELRFLGWDMAYSKDNGWVIVEVNTAPGMTATQASALSGFKKDFMNILPDMGLMIPFRFRKL